MDEYYSVNLSFTFQYVSIISVSFATGPSSSPKFTFQYVSIISTYPKLKVPFVRTYLHSNMFLLFLFFLINQVQVHHYLHSNMFLLFPRYIVTSTMTTTIYIPICFYYFSEAAKAGLILLGEFTFQYVSIISCPDGYNSSKCCIIYIPICFYYFSINFPLSASSPYLHSNMFLLFLLSVIFLQFEIHHLHSNMFLLFLKRHGVKTCIDNNLHSNMFLLFL